MTKQKNPEVIKAKVAETTAPQTPEINPQLELNKEDYTNIVNIINLGSYSGEQSEYISTLKYKIRTKIEQI